MGVRAYFAEATATAAKAGRLGEGGRPAGERAQYHPARSAGGWAGSSYTDSFSYRVSDGKAYSNFATVTMTVLLGGNHSPVA